MAFTVYILHTQSLDKFYIGYTAVPIAERLRRHNTNHKGFTGKVNDWKVVYTEIYIAKADAIAREQQLKKLKSKAAIAQLDQSIPT